MTNPFRRPPNIDAQIEQWGSTALVHMSPHSQRAYRSTVQAWSNSGLMPLEYIGSLYERGNKHATVKVRRSILRSFFSWQRAAGYAKTNPLEGSPAPRVDETVIQALTVGEVAKLLEGCEQIGKEHSDHFGANLGAWPVEVYRARVAAMAALQVSSGLRLGELLTLTDADIDLRDRAGTCRGKGRKERPFRFGRPARRALLRWVEMRDVHLGRPATRLFVSSTNAPVSAPTYREQLKQAAWWAGIGPVHPHMLRHTFATAASAAGTPVQDLQSMLGHSNITTTMLYVHDRDRTRAWRELEKRSADEGVADTL